MPIKHPPVLFATQGTTALALALSLFPGALWHPGAEGWQLAAVLAAGSPAQPRAG